VELHLPESRSLKAKRALVKPMLEVARRRFSVAAAEVDHQDFWQRATLGMAVVTGTASHAEAVLDQLERYLWSQPEVEVLGCRRSWLEETG
jgi:uncharacterized protein YlxP (DUF503 family)